MTAAVIGNGVVGGDQVVRGGAPVADPEVACRASRRRFTQAYKLRVLDEADRCAEGQIGALLRREGLYSSHLTYWRRQRERGLLGGRRRGRRAAGDGDARRIAALEQENRRLRHRLSQAEAVITVQKKLSALLEIDPGSGRNG